MRRYIAVLSIISALTLIPVAAANAAPVGGAIRQGHCMVC